MEYCIEYLIVLVSFQFWHKIDFSHTKNKDSHTDCNMIVMYYNKIEKNENNKNMNNYTQKLWNVENYGILQVKTIS